MLKNTMDLYVETLTGTAFELRVSQFETVISVKAKIQRQEGIPISQQHLIWQSMELEDDYCLHDYSIGDGATVKLVLAMRGGPINTRRVALEDPALREMAEYMEANRDELLDKIPGNRQVTLLVYKEGDQLNFFRVVDRGDGTLTPLSESLSGASVYNLYDEGEESDESRDKGEENDKTKEKMKALRLQMADLSIAKKPKKVKPRPPSSGRPGSKSRRNIRHHTFSASKHPSSLPSKHVLPPVGQTVSASSSVNNVATDSTPIFSQLLAQKQTESKKSSVPTMSDSQGAEGGTSFTQARVPPVLSSHNAESLGPLLQASHYIRKASTDQKVSSSSSTLAVSSSHHHKVSSKEEITIDSIKDSIRPKATSRGLESILSDSSDYGGSRREGQGEPLVPRPPTTSRYGGGMELQKGLILESLSQHEARGLLRQASLERLGSSSISQFVSSGGKARVPSFNIKDQPRIPTPETRLLSARLKMSNGREGRTSPTNRLPPVKQKKKSKRCFICTKKTGLANSYMCRCGNNFCATHRYAEAHDCTFDYKTEGRKLLEQSNPVVSAPKLPKI